ncbi:MAG: transport permease protein [Acidimicrobiia bacterium]|nr:MAG: transport permease protein [Acidimicrobiia bacterium]
MWALVAKEFRQMRRDRRTLAMMILMPLVMLVVFGYAASFDVTTIRTGVFGPRAEQATALVDEPFVVDEVDPTVVEDDARLRLRDGRLDVALVTSDDGAKALVDGSRLFKAQAALRGFTAARAALPALEVEVLFNPDLDTSVVLVPGLAGLILIFVGTLLTSLGVVRERQAGTLEQLAVMPFRGRDVFFGKIAPYLLVATLDLAVVLAAGILLFDVPFNGSPATLALGAALFLFVTLGVGVLISSVSENQGQAIQLALMTVLPQVLLSGIIFPLDSMAPGVRWLGYLLPLTYFNQIAQGVMVRGAPLSTLLTPTSVLAAMGVAVFGLAVLRFARELAPARIEENTT